MTSARVVPSFNPGKYGQARLGLRLPCAPGDEFTLQAGKETLGHGVVVCVTYRPHRWTHSHLLAPVTKGYAGVLGEFNRLSQHLNKGGVVWADQRGGCKDKPAGLRCIRQADLG